MKAEVLAVPYGSWTKNKELREVGQFQKRCFDEGLDAYSFAIFTRLLGWTIGEVRKFLAEVRSELQNKKYHWYWPL